MAMKNYPALSDFKPPLGKVASKTHCTIDFCPDPKNKGLNVPKLNCK